MEVGIEKVESLDRIKTLISKIVEAMKNYSKAKMIAKNLATGSYAAGCPAEERGGSDIGKYSCINCERTK